MLILLCIVLQENVYICCQNCDIRCDVFTVTELCNVLSGRQPRQEICKVRCLGDHVP